MVKIIAAILAAAILNAETAQEWQADRAWFSMTEEQRMEAPTELKARAVGLTTDEFDLMSRVVEAESDRSNSIEGRILIALVIFNRVEDGRFEDGITEVCCEDGQFEVVENGTIWSVGRTELSDWAIIEAHQWLAEGDAPAVMYFNNSGYSYGQAYGYVDGNYFVEA